MRSHHPPRHTLCLMLVRVGTLEDPWSNIPILLFFAGGPAPRELPTAAFVVFVACRPFACTPFVVGRASSFSCSRALNLRGPRCAADIDNVCKEWRATRVLMDAVLVRYWFRGSFALENRMVESSRSMLCVQSHTVHNNEPGASERRLKGSRTVMAQALSNVHAGAAPADS